MLVQMLIAFDLYYFAAVIKTLDGQICRIPFIFQGEIQNACVEDPIIGFWCSLVENFDDPDAVGEMGICDLSMRIFLKCQHHSYC